ncbi:MAG: amino acid ABC transporter permease [Pseudomonadales bacterium]|nr:amino acid ABC transporter permease [Pseudomonadales bacterium]
MRIFSRLLLVVATLAMVSGCTGSGDNGNWGWYVVSPATGQGMTNIKFLLGGLKDTIILSLASIVLAMVLGFLIALPGIAANRTARVINVTYVELVRAIPLLVLILWVYYGLPQVAGISIGIFLASVLALGISDSAFQAEIFRAGIQSVPKGQIEAADALGLRYSPKMRLIILPQAIKVILPPLGNQFVYILKMSSLASVIGMQELTRRANELVVTEYRPLEIYTFLILEYLVLILIVSAGVRWLERKMQTEER